MGKLRKLSLGLLAALWLAACAVPTAPPMPTLIPTISPQGLTTNPNATPLAPTAITDAQGYPGQISPANLPQGYPGGGSGFVFPTLTPIPAIQWSVPVTEITGLSDDFPPLEFRPPQTSPSVEARCEPDASKLTLWVNGEKKYETALSFFATENVGCPSKTEVAPDGSAILLMFQQGEAYLWRLDGSLPKALGKICPAQYSSPWSPNSKRLAFSLQPCQIGFQNNASVRVVDQLSNLQTQ